MNMEDCRNRLSVLDIISKFEKSRPDSPNKPENLTQENADMENTQSQKYLELTDSGPVGGAKSQWRGLQTFRRKATSTRLSLALIPLTEVGGQDQEGQDQEGQDQEGQGEKMKMQETNRKKLYKIASELLETEKAYVKRLQLLDQGFFFTLLQEARLGSFPEDVVRQIFSNISCIHQFHSGFLLPELQRRMAEWDKNPRIGDVLQKVAPFLKMYGEYVKAFDRAMELITTWREKSPRFEELVLQLQKQEASASLTLQHHMLEPVQRIPRYEMLLKDYLKKLPENSADRPDAQKALDIIFEAAKHSNAAIADMERLEKLWEVYSLLGMGDEMVDPSNRLLREGPVLKMSFRNNIGKESHLFLVKEMKDAEIPHSFLISGKSCTLEFQARSQADMEAWIKACEGAIEQNEKKSESFRSVVSCPGPEEQQVVEHQELGKRAPQWIRDNLVSMCMRCGEKFNALIRRRHHCRACGQVVCWRCSDYKAALQYDCNRVNRVCRDCYTLLVGGADGPAAVERKRGILEKEAGGVSDTSLLCSFLTMIDKQGKSRGWFVIPRDEPLVLYMYLAPQDVKAQVTIPLLGYQVKQLSGDKCAFQLSQSKLLLTFLAETEELRDRWVKVINRVAIGDYLEDED